MKDASKFETSDPFPYNEEVSVGAVKHVFKVERGKVFVIQGWRFTSRLQLKPEHLQQLAVLLDPGMNRFLARLTLQSLITIPGVQERQMKTETLVTPAVLESQHAEVYLQEMQIPDVYGLRVHLYGLEFPSLVK